MNELGRKDLMYPELSYQIVGCAFDVHNELAGGHHEKYYQRALHEAFQEKNLQHVQQIYFPLEYRDTIIGKNFLDFLVENKVVVEIKKGDRYSKKHIDQVLQYLKITKMKLAILINFGSKGVAFKRIVNFDS